MKTETLFVGALIGLSTCLFFSCNQSKTSDPQALAADSTAVAADSALSSDSVPAEPKVSRDELRKEVEASLKRMYDKQYFHNLSKDEVESNFLRLIKEDEAYVQKSGELGYYNFDVLYRCQDGEDELYAYEIGPVTVEDDTHAAARVTIYPFGKSGEGMEAKVKVVKEDGKWKLADVDNDVAELKKLYK